MWSEAARTQGLTGALLLALHLQEHALFHILGIWAAHLI